MLVVLERNEDMGLLNHEDLDHLFIEVSGSGYKAVSCMLMWFILYVTTYPEIQAKVCFHVSQVTSYHIIVYLIFLWPLICIFGN